MPLDVLRARPRPALLLDYDGTLVPFATAPELARPDPELLELLGALARVAPEVHIVSGRSRETVGEWLGHLPVDLWAEHGLWHRARSADGWVAIADPPVGWMAAAAQVMQQFAERTPGSLVERKSRSLAWHYRLADAERGALDAKQLGLVLTALLRDEPVEILNGHKVVEIRPRGVNKGCVVRHVLAGPDAPARIVALGDDRTDEDMFAALPPSGISVLVGGGPSRATYRLADWRDARALLAGLLD